MADLTKVVQYQSLAYQYDEALIWPFEQRYGTSDVPLGQRWASVGHDVRHAERERRVHIQVLAGRSVVLGRVLADSCQAVAASAALGAVGDPSSAEEASHVAYLEAACYASGPVDTGTDLEHNQGQASCSLFAVVDVHSRGLDSEDRRLESRGCSQRTPAVEAEGPVQVLS